jgi:hypothetical protein
MLIKNFHLKYKTQDYVGFLLNSKAPHQLFSVSLYRAQGVFGEYTQACSCPYRAAFSLGSNRDAFTMLKTIPFDVMIKG